MLVLEIPTTTTVSVFQASKKGYFLLQCRCVERAKKKTAKKEHFKVEKAPMDVHLSSGCSYRHTQHRARLESMGSAFRCETMNKNSEEVQRRPRSVKTNALALRCVG